MKRIFVIGLCCIVWGAVCAYAQVPATGKQRLTSGWEFIRGDLGNVWEAVRPVQAGKPESVPLWQKVTLPHCFNAQDAVDPDVNYYQGPGWYRTLLEVDNPYPSGRTLLEFEGAGQKTDVYVYTRKVASHVGGYDAWTADITEAVAAFSADPVCRKQFGGKIPVIVRCDNSRDREMIPSDMSDFNLYGGLYRYVNLVYVPAVHFREIRVDAATDERGKVGTVALDLLFSGFSRREADGRTGSLKRIPVELTVRMTAPDGREVYTDSRQLQQLPTAEADAEAPAGCTWLHVADLNVKRPQLWSPSQPDLYRVELQLVCGADTLRAEERFGFRHFRFEENGPFYLNGSRLLLRGTHRHEDHAGVGAALTEEMMRREMEQIKAMGANFIRLGHYQQSEIILRLCDELGILVWEEIPWCRGGLGGETYREQARCMLTAMIHQHRNHPSVILWGLGNENDWPGDFETFDKEEIRAFMAELHALAHRTDPSRLTCIRRCDFCKDVVDVYSPTIWAGWYSKRFQDYAAMERAGFESVPRFLHAEWGADSHAGRHAENPASFDIEAGDRNGDWSESYAVRLFDWHLKEQERMPWLTGSLFWTFKDFSTPLRPENPIPYVNQKGVVERDGTPKESYYVFQSYWSEMPMVHIYGHNWPVRWGDAGEEKEVLVYSNCDEVELLLNGESYGKRRRRTEDFPAAGLHWNVVFREGANCLEAIARQGKTVVRDTLLQTYQTARWGAPAALRLSVSEVDADQLLLTAQLVDEAGTPCLDAADVLEFGATDPCALLVHQGTSRGSRRIQAANGRAEILLHRSALPATFSVSDRTRTVTSAFLSLTADGTMAPAAADSLSFTVHNPLAEERREELVELSFAALCRQGGWSAGQQLVLRDAGGREVPYQVTYDSLLVFPATVGALTTARYTLRPGVPAPIAVSATGRVYPERFDDLAWESDLSAYRAYGPALQRRGDRLYGYDVFTKSTPHPVLEQRYARETSAELRALAARLRRTGDKAGADSLLRAISYHVDHGDGMDCYAVGPTLGAGGAALEHDGEIQYAWAYDRCEILDNGPLRFTARLTFAPRAIGCDTVVEERIITLDRGSHLNRTRVRFRGLTAASPVVAGIVRHQAHAEGYYCDEARRFVAYADPTQGTPEANGWIYIGVLAPKGFNEVGAEPLQPVAGDAVGHVLGRTVYRPGEWWEYYWGAAWSRQGYDSLAAWTAYLEDFARRVVNPMK